MGGDSIITREGKRMGRRFQLIFWLMAFFSSFAFAGEFEGLEPGVSTKRDADRVLGKPIREVIRGIRYDYDPRSFDRGRRLSIKFNRDTQVIETIDLYSKGKYTKSQYREWFELGNPARTARDADDNLVEFYMPQGIALHFDGSDDSSPVEFFSHFAPTLIEKVMEAFREKGYGVKLGTTETREKSVKSEERRSPYVREKPQAYYEHAARDANNMKDCAARQIIEEGLRFYPGSSELWKQKLLYYVRLAGTCKPKEPFEIRKEKGFEAAMRAFEIDPSPTNIVNLGWLYHEGYDDCSSALYYYEMAEKSYAQRNPDLYYWMATCYEKMNEFERARVYYDQFLHVAPDHNNAPEAKKRLKKLRGR